MNRLLVTDLDTPVTDDHGSGELVKLQPDEKAQDARARVRTLRPGSAPVVDGDGKLIGRVTVNAVVDFIREETDSEKLSAGGLREEEDLFASVWSSVKNRWTWLAINLVTAFIASRVIGMFEGSIEKAGRAGGADADRRRYRRQLRQPDHYDDRARAGARPDHRRQCAQAVRQGNRRQFHQRADLGQRGRLVRVPDLSQWQLGLVMTGAMVLNLLLAAFMGVRSRWRCKNSGATRRSGRAL